MRVSSSGNTKAVTLYERGHLISGKYELEEVLGQGGMGAVWRARNTALDSLVAIKVLQAKGDMTALRGRLLQEARAAAKLTHPAIVKVFDVGQTERGDPFIVMELLHGSSLGTVLAQESRMPAIQAVRVLLPIADALWLAHGKGIVHRDMKPDNIFIVQHEGTVQPKLVDFGIVKVQGAEAESHLTQAGAVLGSPDYMSPEQARGLDDIDHLTDLWSFSVVLYEAVAGRTPFQGNNYNALLRQIVEDTPPTLKELAAADDELSKIVMRGLSKDRSQRFASMGELGRALASWLIAHGVHEDICGTTLETRWLRGTDPHGRPAGRASIVSITDEWHVERGSGVRPNPLPSAHTLPEPVAPGGVNTLPAPPRQTGEAAQVALAEAPAPARRLPGWWPLAAAAGLVVGVIAFLLFRAEEPRPPVETSVSALPTAAADPVAPPPSAPVAPPSAEEPNVPEPAAPSPVPPVSNSPVQKPAVTKRPRVSSPGGRGSAAGVGRPAPAPPAARQPKPGSDLLKPYQ
jgi:serine/threonine-protein kinase